MKPQTTGEAVGGWKLSRRALVNNPAKGWSELGNFVSLAEASAKISKEDATVGHDRALFLKVYVDMDLAINDAEVLSRFEYKTETALYIISRKLN